MDVLPDGWIDLLPVSLDRSGGRLVLDCIVARVCLGPDDGGDLDRSDLDWEEGAPIGIVVRADPGPSALTGGPAADVDRWLRDGAIPTLLVDAPGPKLLLARGADLLALDVDPASCVPGRVAD